ncbi:MAG: hypothetical protein L3J91_00465, partial [Thermoplasmata archaeon]|nr:hypothetical protein [Thermoplasmata archaeon]
MKGTGRANGAITFVNALATGTGSAAGISLAVEAVVDLEPTGRPTTLSVPPDSDSAPLTRLDPAPPIRPAPPGPLDTASPTSPHPGTGEE